ncbi:MAG: hypothetical protein Kow0047_09720 [Anaerolineae bacterium]
MIKSLSHRRAWLHIAFALAATLTLAAPVFASTATLAGKAYGMKVSHPNLPHRGTVWAGTVYVTIDGGAEKYQVYCVDLHTNWCNGKEHYQGSDVSRFEIVWILNHYYPKTDEPSSLSTAEEKAAAVQLALWHFSDGLDISSGGTPSEVFDAARAIITAAKTASVPKTPTQLDLELTEGPGQGERTATATLKDQNGHPLPGATVHFEITVQSNPPTQITQDVVTDANGVATVTYNTLGGQDTALARVEYTIPIGLRWLRDGCQGLVMGQEAHGVVQADDSIGSPTAVTLSSLSARYGSHRPWQVPAVLLISAIIVGGVITRRV